MEQEVIPALPPRKRGLYWAFKAEAESPQGNDEVWACMSEAAAQELLRGDFGDRIDEIFESREAEMPPMEPHHMMQFIRRGLQHSFLNMFPEDYPNKFRTVEINRHAINSL